jgi:hypothetical protein
MVNWMQALWQVKQSWSFLRHAYRCGCSLYDEAASACSQRRYAVAYAVAQVRPRTRVLSTRYY